MYDSNAPRIDLDYVRLEDFAVETTFYQTSIFRDMELCGRTQVLPFSP